MGQMATNMDGWKVYDDKENTCMIYKNDENSVICAPKDQWEIVRIGDTFNISTTHEDTTS